MPGRNAHSREHIEAVVSAQVDHGYTARRASEAAAAGELPGGEHLEPFVISESTCRHHAGAERRERGIVQRVQRGELGEAIEREALRIVAIVQRQIDELEQADTPDIARLGELVGILRRANGIGGGRTRAPRRKDDEPAAGDDFIGGLVAADRANGSGASG
jgi:hypothetical protein